MKKRLLFTALIGMFLFVNPLLAQEDSTTTENVEMITEGAEEADSSVQEEVQVEEAVEEVVSEVEEASAPVEEAEEDGFFANVEKVTQEIKKKFIDGGPLFMSFVLIALILGLALSIERIIYLNLATTNTEKLLEDIESAMSNGGVESAKEVCRNTRGPVASIFLQGLERSSEGIEMVEKSVIAYGGVQMGLLERGLSWIGLFIALAPMLGFMGTVIGMIDAFDIIEAKGEAKPDELAGGIKVALITTVSGLIVAIILQIFYNYIVSKIDTLVNQMEDASISLIDVLVKHDLKK
ncbi:MAG: MotA/TolQ/ExbB proton channel family protein [Bacteroidota bacterium]|nr:MotA/TolQ/ExbB proton channel family protein [Bacteroidota bacterium]MEC8030477.1 MotA/TolQ/ExbB proton channel family protein [Bacteroidota bacterium]MEC8407712.1 MotA/TolQ/ExbB proton channel family protein [Bacteroidota bacterium]MEC8459396.1 MotA/TolQ/ExbB proton channel family protein [Bacteroidota bacterium]MEC9187007.1 MotA/TolQ/ExbB proton channel family protein [Bacteroidota bacterium]|tara:strand:- start:247 stop:1128 length:882 start_codon:yes stop_codon:yes gene_type:complete